MKYLFLAILVLLSVDQYRRSIETAAVAKHCAKPSTQLKLACITRSTAP
jgi:hypothetical protein